MADKDFNKRSSEYYRYLSNHINNVRRAWLSIRNKLMNSEEYSYLDFKYIDKHIDRHDESKYSSYEFIPYLNYFYPSDSNKTDLDEFNKAWLHHQHVNSHHWQYYTLIQDDGKVVPTDMNVSDVIEMLCDWQSFSYDNPSSTAASWYNSKKDIMILSDKTRSHVERLLKYFS